MWKGGRTIMDQSFNYLINKILIWKVWYNDNRILRWKKFENLKEMIHGLNE
jgi:hypothetical protein